jgi:hypothetical protein
MRIVANIAMLPLVFHHVNLGRPLPGPASFPEREIFHDEVAFATRERATTSVARYLAFNGFWTDLIAVAPRRAAGEKNS